MTEKVAPATDDALDWTTSPDLMGIDDKLTVAFGPSDEATDAWVGAALMIGTADCARGRRVPR